MDLLKKTFDQTCGIQGTVGAAAIAEDGTPVHISGVIQEPDETYVLANLMKESARLVNLVHPETAAIKRVTVASPNGTARIVSTPYQGHILAVKFN